MNARQVWFAADLSQHPRYHSVWWHMSPLWKGLVLGFILGVILGVIVMAVLHGIEVKR